MFVWDTKVFCVKKARIDGVVPYIRSYHIDIYYNK
jgi:hypothetical protein